MPSFGGVAPAPNVAEVHAVATARLTAAEAKAHGIASDDPRADQVHEWALRLSHEHRIARLYELGERTDDLWVGLRRMLANYAEGIGRR